MLYNIRRFTVFSLKSGKKVLPTLYILSLEPLLAHINLELHGIQFPLGDQGPRYCAYADDMAIFLTRNVDVMRLHRLLELDSSMSGSKINTDKSILYTLDPDTAELISRTLGYQVKEFVDRQFKYLGVQYKGVNWRQFAGQQAWRMSTFCLNLYPPHLRAKAINSLVLPKTIYRDLTWPMSKKDATFFDRRLYEHFFKGISEERVYGTPNRGGYGLIRLQQQLLGRRAKMIFELFAPDASTSWAKLNLIHRLHEVAVQVTRFRDDNAPYKLLLDKTYLPEVLKLPTLEDREKSWLEAWFDTVTLKIYTEIPLGPLADLPTKYLRGKFDPERTPLSESTFHSLHKKSCLKSDWIDVPAWPEKHFQSRQQPSRKEWQKFWNHLLKYTSAQPWQLDILWQFYHGYTARWMWHSYENITEDQQAAFYYPGCTLCLTTNTSLLESVTFPQRRTDTNDHQFRTLIKLIREGGGGEHHTLCECPVSRTIYRLVNQTDHPYEHVTDILPPHRLTLVQFLELARFLRATLLLFKETRLSELAPVRRLDDGWLQLWIVGNQRYIMTGKGQHKF